MIRQTEVQRDDLTQHNRALLCRASRGRWTTTFSCQNRTYGYSYIHLYSPWGSSQKKTM